MNAHSPESFADFRPDAVNWITLANGEYYPDILSDARELYTPVLALFGQLLRTSESSERLFMQIADIPDSWMRVQVARVFKRYVSPSTPVEMLRRKTRAREICDQFGPKFRPIHEVQAAYLTRPVPDEVMCALLWEHKDRGKKGYDLTERFFDLFRTTFPSLIVLGPPRAGKDIPMAAIFEDYPNPKRPVDFAIYDETGADVLAIGLARYDSDRGGSQEDDRIGGYHNAASEILHYAQDKGFRTKVIFLNDGPGLLLGSMWNDYAQLERNWPGRVIVTTLRMIPARITIDWLLS